MAQSALSSTAWMKNWYSYCISKAPVDLIDQQASQSCQWYNSWQNDDSWGLSSNFSFFTVFGSTVCYHIHETGSRSWLKRKARHHRELQVIFQIAQLQTRSVQCSYYFTHKLLYELEQENNCLRDIGKQEGSCRLHLIQNNMLRTSLLDDKLHENKGNGEYVLKSLLLDSEKLFWFTQNSRSNFSTLRRNIDSPTTSVELGIPEHRKTVLKAMSCILKGHWNHKCGGKQAA